MMNHELAHWRLVPAIPSGDYQSTFTTSLAPDSPYQIRAMVAKARGTEGPFAFSFAVLTDQADVLGIILSPEQFTEDPTDWANHPTRYDACRAAEAWLERNRTLIAAIAQETIDASRWQLPQ